MIFVFFFVSASFFLVDDGFATESQSSCACGEGSNRMVCACWSSGRFRASVPRAPRKVLRLAHRRPGRLRDLHGNAFFRTKSHKIMHFSFTIMDFLTKQCIFLQNNAFSGFMEFCIFLQNNAFSARASKVREWSRAGVRVDRTGTAQGGQECNTPPQVQRRPGKMREAHAPAASTTPLCLARLSLVTPPFIHPP